MKGSKVAILTSIFLGLGIFTGIVISSKLSNHFNQCSENKECVDVYRVENIREVSPIDSKNCTSVTGVVTDVHHLGEYIIDCITLTTGEEVRVFADGYSKGDSVNLLIKKKNDGSIMVSTISKINKN